MADACKTCQGDLPPHCFVHERAFEDDAFVGEMLEVICGISTTADDFLCIRCYRSLQDAFAFRTNYRDNQRRRALKSPRVLVRMRYSCTRCRFVCDRNTHFENHAKTHDTIFRCDKCNYSTRNKNNFANHMPIHDRVKAFACDKCNYRTHKSQCLKNHTLTHSEVTPFACDKCDYKTNAERNLKSHSHIHDTEKVFACDKCKYRTHMPQHLKIHILTHSGVEAFACDKYDYNTTTIVQDKMEFSCMTCKFTCYSKKDLNQHTTQHERERSLISAQLKKVKRAHSLKGTCGVFKRQKNPTKRSKTPSPTRETMDTLSTSDEDYESVDHLQSKVDAFIDHADITPSTSKLLLKLNTAIASLENRQYQCDMCNYKSGKKNLLRTHIINHNAVKKYQCDICSYKCKEKGTLRKHIECHATTKKYQCDKCDKWFTVKVNLINHLKRHFLKRDHVCDRCGHACKTLVDLQDHMIQHTTNRSFACDLCNFACKLKRGLVQHKKKYCNGKQGKRCSTCNVRFVSDESLRLHVENAACPKRCDPIPLKKPSGTGESDVVRDVRHHVCLQCPYACVRKTTMEYHVRMHSIGARHVCGLCGYATDNGQTMNKHKRSHDKFTYIKVKTLKHKHVCQRCNKAFMFKQQLVWHSEVCFNEK